MERIDNIGFGDLKLIQNPDEFCYGVDAVILADSVDTGKLKDASKIVVDLGTGTGVVPLILSSKTNAKIIGIEIQKDSFDRANRNAKLNEIEDRISFVNADVKEYINWGHGLKSSIDVVTSNPPYMAKTSGLKNDNSAKMIARHETTADLNDFISASSFLLKDKGDFYLVHRPSRLVDILCYGREHNLETKEIRFVSPKKGEEPNILLVHMVKNGGKELKYLPTLYIHEENGEYTPELLNCYK